MLSAKKKSPTSCEIGHPSRMNLPGSSLRLAPIFKWNLHYLSGGCKLPEANLIMIPQQQGREEAGPRWSTPGKSKARILTILEK